MVLLGLVFLFFFLKNLGLFPASSFFSALGNTLKALGLAPLDFPLPLPPLLPLPFPLRSPDHCFILSS